MPRKRPPNLDQPTPKERQVTEAEEALWHQVMDRPLPLLLQHESDPSDPVEDEPPATDELPAMLRASDDQLQQFATEGIAGTKNLKSAENQQVSRIDWRTARAIRRGKREPEATLDLHGLYREQAHRVLSDFLQSSQRQNHRFVLVITGKGSRRDEHGVLRAALPQWLSTSPCREAVQAFTPAGSRHGGDGAWYVLLRKP